MRQPGLHSYFNPVITDCSLKVSTVINIIRITSETADYTVFICNSNYVAIICTCKICIIFFAV